MNGVWGLTLVFGVFAWYCFNQNSTVLVKRRKSMQQAHLVEQTRLEPDCIAIGRHFHLGKTR